ncbi:MAG: hypothetical protein Q8K18_01705 [Burkholderiales bacterium]|nr:hypothetical protein [Burkholderiales bacterium]
MRTARSRATPDGQEVRQIGNRDQKVIAYFVAQLPRRAQAL